MSHATKAEVFIDDKARTAWHDETLWFIRKKRDIAAQKLPEWEALREWASAIKSHTISKLDHYLIEFEQNALSNGVVVHWAADGKEHNEIVEKIIKEAGCTRLVKSKSMLTEECHLNDYLQTKGIEVIDTDLGERIVQLRKEHPSHIVLPAIHLKKKDVSETFTATLGAEPGNEDPEYLTRLARHSLRKDFLASKVAITGVNFAIAETGGIVVCTNEGNADMGVNNADVHIACMGIEKLLPKKAHLGIFTRLLTRSATGQPITIYTSHYKKPQPGKQMHVVIVDNGRTRQLASDDFRSSLKCIRCAACFNTCPVYRRSGGHSYDAVIAGPIGSILSPNYDPAKHADLPFASTLCGSCSNVCPVKIDIHDQLWKWRQKLTEQGHSPRTKTLMMKGMAWILGNKKRYAMAGKWGRKVMRIFPSLINNKFNPWYKQRDMPEPPKESFQEWYKKNHK